MVMIFPAVAVFRSNDRQGLSIDWDDLALRGFTRFTCGKTSLSNYTLLHPLYSKLRGPPAFTLPGARPDPALAQVSNMG